MPRARAEDPLSTFHAPVREWFRGAFDAPTPAQAKAWPVIAKGASTLLLAPTGSGKTLAAFLVAIDRLLFEAPPGARPRAAEGVRVLYISPLKALLADIERNLRAPLAGVALAAERSGSATRALNIAVRSGDTPAAERARMARRPPDILATTPESLFLLLTSQARSVLESVDTVIIDEIHAVAGSKRGAHLALSLERLEALRGKAFEDKAFKGKTLEGKACGPLQRIGLSATQRPLDLVSAFLGGGTAGPDGVWRPRPVEVIDAGARKELSLCVESAIEERTGRELEEASSGPASQGPARASAWPGIHRRLLELIRKHHSTIIFVNSRRLAERLAAALCDAAGEEIALAHHGSVAAERREEIEDRLKRGILPAIVSTSSLELGIDMGAVELVIQIEAPPSIVSGLQRIGRANHSVGKVPRGVLAPKHRGDLLACAACVPLMLEGRVEETRVPRNPLDVLAQQAVAIAAMEELSVDSLHDLVRGASPFRDLPRPALVSVLDMLSGRYPSHELRGLRPRLIWNRATDTLRAREGARSVVVSNAGTIPDRGLYGVVALDREGGRGRRIGELDEEMVFETQPGDVFLLGASSWRVQEITHDRVVVSPAPGEPGKMPFWRGDGLGRSLELGRAIGALTRVLSHLDAVEAAALLVEHHALEEEAARLLHAYVREQVEATGEPPSDRTILLERYLDEVGDWRLCILTPFGARVHAPWATAVGLRLERELGRRVEALWSDDGLVFRLGDLESLPGADTFFPEPEEVEPLLLEGLGSTSMFRGRFREASARALLLPRWRAGKRTPLWAQRKRAADLFEVASRFDTFPMILEAVRECLQDVFDLPGLREVLRGVRERRIRVREVETRTPSPFAGSLLFSYVASFIYQGDAPLAERRAQALLLDPTLLQELLGEAELRDLLDPDAALLVERRLQRMEKDRKLRGTDGVHDLLLELGPLTIEEVAGRLDRPEAAEEQLEQLGQERRAIITRIADEERWAAIEDASRLRDGLGAPLPPGVPRAFLEPTPDPLGDLVSRHARTHGPLRATDLAARLGIPERTATAALARLLERGKVVRGELLPGPAGTQWCDAEVLRSIKRLSLARLRKEAEPVDGAAFTRFTLDWQGITRPRRSPDGLLEVIEELEGCPLLASILESEILPARLHGYEPAHLDALMASGAVVWQGIEAVAPGDGRVALHTAERARDLLRSPRPAASAVASPLASQTREVLAQRGASFFSTLVRETGQFSRDVLEALWDLVWAGEVSNDTLAPLRSLMAARRPRRGVRARARPATLGPPGSEGRWLLLTQPASAVEMERAPRAAETTRRVALAGVLLARHGIVVRETAAAEGITGGFSAVYDVLKGMEERGQARRGYFVEGLGGLQFASRGAGDRLRSFREPPTRAEARVLAAADPAIPYGAILPWPAHEGARLERRAGARVVIVDGQLAAYLRRREGHLSSFLPAEEPARGHLARGVALALAGEVGSGRRGALLIRSIDGGDPAVSPLTPHLVELGFQPGAAGLLLSNAGNSARLCDARTPGRERRLHRAGASPTQEGEDESWSDGESPSQRVEPDTGARPTG